MFGLFGVRFASSRRRSELAESDKALLGMNRSASPLACTRTKWLRWKGATGERRSVQEGQTAAGIRRHARLGQGGIGTVKWE
jgi:hypothetical protein